MKVRFKRLTPDAVAPTYLNNKANSGLVLVATSKIYDKHGNATFGTGISVDIPQGYVGLLLPLEGNYKKDLIICSLRTIEPGNNEELVFKFRPAAFFADECKEDEEEGIGNDSNTYDYISFGKQFIEDTDTTQVYNVGDYVGQLLIVPKPKIEMEEVISMLMGDFSNDFPYRD